MIKKTKAQLRKEIAELIDNIKEHADEIGDKKRIPQLELEVISAKIKKLYETSVVYNYLHKMEDEEENGHTETFNPQNIAPLNGDSEKEKQTKIIASEPIIEITERTTPVLQNKATSKSAKDVKSFIGINDKFRFINELFKGNASEYEEVIKTLNLLDTDEETNIYISSLVQKHMWDMESEMFELLIKIIDKRFL